MEQNIETIEELVATQETLSEAELKSFKSDLNSYFDEDVALEIADEKFVDDSLTKKTDSPTLQEKRKSFSVREFGSNKNANNQEKVTIENSTSDKIEKKVNDEMDNVSREDYEEFAELIISSVDFGTDKLASTIGYTVNDSFEAKLEKKRRLLKKLTVDVMIKHKVKFKIEYLLIGVIFSYGITKFNSLEKKPTDNEYEKRKKSNKPLSTSTTKKGINKEEKVEQVLQLAKEDNVKTEEKTVSKLKLDVNNIKPLLNLKKQ